MDGRVVVYRLAAKLVEREAAVPDDARDVLYYTLSVGHHTGVMDCFSEQLACSCETFLSVMEHVPEGPARYKLEGLLRFGEIQIDKTHVEMLKPALKEARRRLYVKRDANPYLAELSWLGDLLQLLDAVEREPALYLMARRIDG